MPESVPNVFCFAFFFFIIWGKTTATLWKDWDQERVITH